MGNLQNKVALVTGAGRASGIGAAVARRLAAGGADIVVSDLCAPVSNLFNAGAGQWEELQAVAAEVEARGVRALPVRSDVTQADSVAALIRATLDAFGRLDILVNNAGLQKDAPFHEMTTAQWDTVMNVNLRGQFLCTREAVRIFMRQGLRPALSSSAGKIICISSVHDVIPWAGHVNYAASKGGVMLMMKSVAQEIAPLRIRVNSICPGAVRTPINTEAWSTREAYNSLMALIPYKRIGEPEELGRAAVWLASDDSDYITGASLYVDGGMTLYPGFETGG